MNDNLSFFLVENLRYYVDYHCDTETGNEQITVGRRTQTNLLGIGFLQPSNFTKQSQMRKQQQQQQITAALPIPTKKKKKKSSNPTSGHTH